MDVNRIIAGDALDSLRDLPSSSVNCIVTSPPYYALRDYGVDSQVGLEATPQAYVCRMAEIFREARRVLRDDGTLWLNVGDTYSKDGKWGGSSDGGKLAYMGQSINGARKKITTGVPGKSLIGIPARLQIALMDDGWLLRNTIIWHKPNCMPSSAKDRLTNSYETVFFFAKTADYWFDGDAVKERAVDGDPRPPNGSKGNEKPGQGARKKQDELGKRQYTGFNARWDERNEPLEFRNGRDVWTIPTQPSGVEHFAMMPEELARRCILAGCPAGGVVLDPFFGSGTTGYVAEREGRQWLGVELNPEYVKIAEKRLTEPFTLPMLFTAEAAS